MTSSPDLELTLITPITTGQQSILDLIENIRCELQDWRAGIKAETDEARSLMGDLKADTSEIRALAAGMKADCDRTWAELEEIAATTDDTVSDVADFGPCAVSSRVISHHAGFSSRHAAQN